MSLVLTSHMAILQPVTVPEGMWCSIGQVWISGTYSLLELMVDSTFKDQLWSGWLSKKVLGSVAYWRAKKANFLPSIWWPQVYFDQKKLVNCKTETQTSIFNLFMNFTIDTSKNERHHGQSLSPLISIFFVLLIFVFNFMHWIKQHKKAKNKK